MIEIKPEDRTKSAEDLYTESVNNGPKSNTQNNPYDPSYSEIIPHMVADFYHGLLKYKIPRKVAGELTGMYLKFTLECVLGIGR